MNRSALIVFAFALLATISFTQAAHSPDPQVAKLINVMRNVNTLEVTFKQENHRFASADELTAYSKTVKTRFSADFARALDPASYAPYKLEVVATADHYGAKIFFPAVMSDTSTHCKTNIYSDDSGVIDLGQNIECSAALNLGASSRPLP